MEVYLMIKVDGAEVGLFFGVLSKWTTVLVLLLALRGSGNDFY